MIEISKDYLVDGKYTIGDLIDLDELRGMLEKFTQATGFTIGFLDHPGMNLLITTGWRDICTKFHRNCPATLDICKSSNKRLLDRLNEPGQLAIEACDNGLVDCATPIIIKGKHIASLATGQLLLERSDLDKFRNQAIKYGFDEREYMKALEEVSVFSEEKVRSTTAFLGQLANLISELGYANLIKIEETARLENEIAERKRVEHALRENESILRTTFGSILDGLLALDFSRGKFVIANDAICRMLGYTHDEICDLGINEIHPESAIPYVMNCFERQRKGETTFAVNIPLKRKDGSIFFTDVSSVPVEFFGQPCLLGVFHDITDRLNIEEVLKISLKEKETLLRELYHRTKNNMQVISSMIGLRASADDSEKVKTVFKDMMAKIKAMSLVHQKLYQSQDLSSINLMEYISELIKLFIQIYGKETKVTVDEKVENISVLIDTAIPLGLIISELLVNSFTHAFFDGRAGKICIDLNKAPDGFMYLRFSDNGPGFDEAFDPRAQNGLGLKSLIALAERQLQGSIEFINDGGLVCAVKFSDDLYKPRV